MGQVKGWMTAGFCVLVLFCTAKVINPSLDLDEVIAGWSRMAASRDDDTFARMVTQAEDGATDVSAYAYATLDSVNGWTALTIAFGTSVAAAILLHLAARHRAELRDPIVRRQYAGTWRGGPQAET